MSDPNSTYCIQRNFRMLFPTPPTRLTIVSPYNQNFSEFDLNMRRKAEILQYNKPASVGNRGNRMTRKELFAQTTRGFNPQQRTARNATPQQLAFCDSSMNITSTADANVPGPSQPLYLDKNVPLYMFSPGNRNFSDNVENNTDTPFVFNVVSSTVESSIVDFPANTRTTIGVLDLKQILESQESTFTLRMIVNSTIDTSHITEFRITLNTSPLYQSVPYTFLLTSLDDNTKTQVTVENIVIPTNASYFYEFQLTFSTGIQIPVESVVFTQV